MGDVSVVCRGFGEEYSESYRLKEYPLFLTYKNETMEQVDKNWFTPSAIVFSSLDGKPAGQKEEAPANRYTEYSVTRSDAYGIKQEAAEYQYESQHLKEWENWENWLEKNKATVECSIMAVRVGRYVLVRMENTGVVVVSTTTLPEEKKNSDIYLTVTGENCSMWDFKDQLEYEAVEEAAIKPVQLTKYYTETKTGDIPNLDCFGWWTTHSDGIEVTEKPVCITFNTISYQQAKESWHTPLIVVFSAFDKLVNGVLYDEYAVIRSDAYAWNAGAGALETETAVESKWTSWDQWLQDNKNGVKASVTAVRQENTILITLENDGVTIETQVQIPMEKNLPVCLSLSGELCYISNIRIK